LRQAFTLAMTILAVNPSVGRAVFHVSCPGAQGCAALAAQPSLVFAPKPFVCLGGEFSWWTLTLTGRRNGRPFRTRVDTCWTPQMALLGKLGIARRLQSHLEPRRVARMLPGMSQTFFTLRPGDLVACRQLRLGVPVDPGQSPSAGRGGLTLAVTRHRDGSVTASCK
jgi:hypothetical protein